MKNNPLKYYAIVSVSLLVMAFNLNETNQIFLGIISGVTIILADRSAAKLVFKKEYVLFLSLFLFLPPLFIGEKSSMAFGISYSAEIFALNQIMALRATLILISIKILTNKLSIDMVTGWIDRSGFGNLSDAVRISEKIRPTLKKIMIESYTEMKSQWKKERRVGVMFDFAVNLSLNIIRFAEKPEISQINGHSGLSDEKKI